MSGKKTVSRCRVWLNSQEVTFFKNFSEDEREIRKMVKLMGGFVIMDTTAPNTFKLDYVKPKGTPIDWDAFDGGTFVVELVGAEKVTFTPASTLKVGEYKVDDENESVQTIVFGAASRRQE